MGAHLATVGSSTSITHAQPRASIAERQLIVEDGDVVVTREVAGIWRSGPGLTAPTVQTLPEYRLSIRGESGADERIFDIYTSAVADGEALAARRNARLVYTEGGVVTLLKDYRPDSRL